MWSCSHLPVLATEIDVGAVIRNMPWGTLVIVCLVGAVFVTAFGFAACHILSLQVGFYSDAAEALRRVARRPRGRRRR